MTSLYENEAEFDDIVKFFEKGEEADSEWEAQDDFEDADADQITFPKLDVDDLLRVATGAGLEVPKPSAVTKAEIAATRTKTPQAGYKRILLSHLLTLFNLTMNKALTSVPETERMTDEEVRDLPGFPTVDDVVVAVAGYLAARGVTETVFREATHSRPAIDFQGDLESEGREHLGNLVANRGRTRWSAEYAWKVYRSSAKGGQVSRRKTTGVTEALLDWRGPLPKVEQLMEQFDIKKTQAYAYLSEARSLRGEP